MLGKNNEPLVIVDADAIIALSSTSDANHEKAKHILRTPSTSQAAGNPWIFWEREKLKKLLNAGINPTPEDLPDAAPSREERLLMALEHARVHAKLKGEDHFIELRKHMGWYLGHFRGAKHIRNELVRINSLADVERIIQVALDSPVDVDDAESDIPQEEVRDPELDLSCAPAI